MLPVVEASAAGANPFAQAERKVLEDVVALRGQGRTCLGIADLGVVLAVSVLSERERSVVNVPHTAKGLRQEAPLRRTWVKPGAVTEEHAKRLYLDMSNYKKNLTAAIPRRPKGRSFLAVMR
jgi:hypothetical protein